MGFHTSRRRVSHWVAGLIGLAALAAAMSAQSASAQTLTWLGTLDGNWGTVTGGTSNWSNNNVPSTSGTTAILLINGGSNLSALTNNIGGLNLWQAGAFNTSSAKVRLEGSTPITLSGSAIRFSGTAASQGICVNLAGTGTHTFSAPIEANCTTLVFAVSGTKYLTSAISEGYGTNCAEMTIVSNATTPANLFLSTVSTATIGNYIQDGGTVTVPGLLSAISPTGITFLRLGSGSNTATVVKTGGAESLASQIRIGTGNLATDTGGVSLINNGSGAWTFSNTGTVNQYVGTILANRTLTLGGTNSDSNTISGIITNNRFDGTNFSTTQGVVSLAKIGTGVWVLSGSNSYTGTTSIAAGILEIGSAGSINATSGIAVNGATAELKFNSATALSKPLALTQGTLSGTGAINTAVVIGSGVVHAPGNSTGIQSVATETWAPGGTYTWELNALSGAAGTNWDQIAVTGLLGLDTLSSGSKFNLNLVTLTGAMAPGPLDIGYVAGSSHNFTIATFGSLTVPVGFSTAPGSDLTNLFNISLAGWQGTKPNLPDISVKVNNASGIDLVIVPEPGAVVLAAIGVGLVGWAARRRWA